MNENERGQLQGGDMQLTEAQKKIARYAYWSARGDAYELIYAAVEAVLAEVMSTGCPLHGSCEECEKLQERVAELEAQDKSRVEQIIGLQKECAKLDAEVHGLNEALSCSNENGERAIKERIELEKWQLNAKKKLAELEAQLDRSIQDMRTFSALQHWCDQLQLPRDKNKTAYQAAVDAYVTYRCPATGERQTGSCSGGAMDAALHAYEKHRAPEPVQGLFVCAACGSTTTYRDGVGMARSPEPASETTEGDGKGPFALSEAAASILRSTPSSHRELTLMNEIRRAQRTLAPAAPEPLSEPLRYAAEELLRAPYLQDLSLKVARELLRRCPKPQPKTPTPELSLEQCIVDVLRICGIEPENARAAFAEFAAKCNGGDANG